LPKLRLQRIDSIAGLHATAEAWDRLWLRSEVTLPTVRAEMVVQWLEQFAPRAAFEALIVHQDDEPVAAMAMVGRRARGLVALGDLTANAWSVNGELLLDPAADVPAVVDTLAAAMETIRWPMVWLDWVPVHSARWQALIAALEERGLACDVHLRYPIGQVKIDGPWSAYFATRSRDLRRNVQKDLRRLEREGPVELRWTTRFAPGDARRLLGQAFEIESQSWKRGRGHSVLETPGMFDYYCRQARQLAQWGWLRLAVLEHRGTPIAFELGWQSKGVYHSYKVGFNDAYRQFGPGHLLRWRLLEKLFGDRQVHQTLHTEADDGPLVVDFQGPMTEALAQWSTQSYPIGRLVIATRRLGGRALMAGYRAMSPVVRRLRVLRNR
jgi:CelD/BcsL family acetyltransferase involved in cellulose biosynthesis